MVSLTPTRFTYALLIVLGLVISPHLYGQEIFTDQLSGPTGITTGLQGHIYVHSDVLSTTLLTQFDANGRGIAQMTIGSGFVGALRFIGSYFATDPGTGTLLMLTPMGDLLAIDPDLTQGQLLFNLLQLPIDASRAFDMQTGRFAPFQLVPQATFGDIAVFRPGNQPNQLDIFTTGISVGFAFVLRLQFDAQGNLLSARVILTSTGTSAGTVNLPRGIAINPQGVGLTTLPIRRPNAPIAGEFPDVAVTFPADFPDNRTTSPRILFGSQILTSWGMTSDTQGNFYVATGVVGSPACGVRASGALVVIPQALNQFFCGPLASGPGVLVRSRDVAVSPTDNRIYVTVSNFNAVVRFAAFTPDRSFTATTASAPVPNDSGLIPLSPLLTSLDTRQPPAPVRHERTSYSGSGALSWSQCSASSLNGVSSVEGVLHVVDRSGPSVSGTISLDSSGTGEEVVYQVDWSGLINSEEAISGVFEAYRYVNDTSKESISGVFTGQITGDAVLMELLGHDTADTACTLDGIFRTDPS